MLHDPVHHICRPEAELRGEYMEALPRIYTALLLRRKKLMAMMVESLGKAGHLGFSRRARCQVEVPPVAKNDGSRRLVIDCHVANALDREPLYALPLTIGAFAHFDLRRDAPCLTWRETTCRTSWVSRSSIWWTSSTSSHSTRWRASSARAAA